MIRARHTLIGRFVSELYAGPLLDRAFRPVRFIGDAADDGLPILMLSNHFSWWDGFIQYRLNRTCFRRRLHVMMLEEQLQKHPILNRCGCFSVRKHSRSVIETLDYCLELMRSPQNMLLIFPQGEIQSMHRNGLQFESGLDYLLKRIDCDYRILLNINLPDYGSGKKPYLNGYFCLLNGREYPRLETLEREADRFYAACKTRQIVSL